MEGWIEVIRHAAFATDATAKRNTHQAAGLRVTPAVIDTDVFPRVAIRFTTDDRTTMRAAIDERGEVAIVLSRHHDRRFADHRRAEITPIRDFGFEAQVIPRRSPEDAFQLFAVQNLV